ncbi:MAG: hypothetical protein AAGA93_16310 [Actinomycetota bacterium]
MDKEEVERLSMTMFPDGSSGSRPAARDPLPLWRARYSDLAGRVAGHAEEAARLWVQEETPPAAEYEPIARTAIEAADALEELRESGFDAGVGQWMPHRFYTHSAQESSALFLERCSDPDFAVFLVPDKVQREQVVSVLQAAARLLDSGAA